MQHLTIISVQVCGETRNVPDPHAVKPSMKLRYLGYACTNVTLSCTTGRTLRLANLTEARAAEVIAENLATLLEILRWNLERGIRFFRVSSAVIPLASHEAFTLEWRTQFAAELAEIRTFVAEHNLRLSVHPGQYTVLNAPRPEVVQKAVRELEYHASFLDAVDPAQGTMTLHVGGAYGDKAAALERFAVNFTQLSPMAQNQLTLENDDRIFTAGEVLGLCERLEVPMIFDFWHHKLNPTLETWDTGLDTLLPQVVDTWGERVPKFHLSSARGLGTAHADLIEPVDFGQVGHFLGSFGGDKPYDLMLEAKLKETALLTLRQNVAALSASA